MIRLACKIPRNIVIACSGGPDSMALLSFCMKGKKNVFVLHVNHGTDHARDAESLVTKFCIANNLPLFVRNVKNNSHNENMWREERLAFYREFTEKEIYVATAHHLNDVAEWYLLSAIHGKAKLMSPIDKEHKLIKPFILTEKDELISWCNKNNIPFVIDPTNVGEDNSRAILRKETIPSLLKIHPGFNSTIRNMLSDSILNKEE